MPQSNITLKSIDVWKQDKWLELHWMDGVVHRLPFHGLHKNCPCVMCRGGHDLMDQYEPGFFLIPTSDSPTPFLDIIRVEVVGRHALKFHWSDGHRDGMYRFELLRYFGEWLDARREGVAQDAGDVRRSGNVQDAQDAGNLENPENPETGQDLFPDGFGNPVP